MQRFGGVRECTEEAKRWKGRSQEDEKKVRWEEEQRKGREEKGGTPLHGTCGCDRRRLGSQREGSEAVRLGERKTPDSAAQHLALELQHPKQQMSMQEEPRLQL